MIQHTEDAASSLSCCAPDGCFCHVQVLQSKKKLLDKLHADVAAKEDRPLKVMLSEDEGVSKRRETCVMRLELMKKAQLEVNTDPQMG